MTGKPLSFPASRERDENEIIKQLVNAYNVSLVQSNQTLHPLDINSCFSCVEAMFINFKHKLNKGYSDRIMVCIKDYKTLYVEAMGIKTKEPGVDRGSMNFLYNLNEDVKTIFVLLMEGLNKEDG